MRELSRAATWPRWISIELGARAGAHAPVSACASSTEGGAYAELYRTQFAGQAVQAG